MKTFEQTRDVLDHARQFHEQVSDYYHRLADKAQKKRVGMLLDYLSRHEKHLEESLADYEEEASETVMNTWFQYTPEESMLASLQGIELEPDMSVDDVIELAMRLDDGLIALYKGMAETADIPEVKEVFENLLEMEEQEKHRLIRNALRANEI